METWEQQARLTKYMCLITSRAAIDEASTCIEAVFDGLPMKHVAGVGAYHDKLLEAFKRLRMEEMTYDEMREYGSRGIEDEG